MNSRQGQTPWKCRDIRIYDRHGELIGGMATPLLAARAVESENALEVECDECITETRQRDMEWCPICNAHLCSRCGHDHIAECDSELEAMRRAVV
jgi:hypothetical protein